MRFLESRVLVPLLLALFMGPIWARPASAQIMGTYNWMPPKKVEEAMEKDLRPGIFVFEIPGEPASTSIRFNFSQPQVLDVLKRNNYAACKIAITDAKSPRPWGSYQKLADEWGVSPTTTMVFVTFDRQAIAVISQVIKRDEFLVFLGQKSAAHKERVRLSEEATTDLNNVEKWIEEKKFGDAARRLKIVLDRTQKISVKVAERAKDLDARLETAGKERLEEGKRLFEGGKLSEAKPVLEEVANVFGRFEFSKEAKELLKKIEKAGRT